MHTACSSLSRRIPHMPPPFATYVPPFATHAPLCHVPPLHHVCPPLPCPLHQAHPWQPCTPPVNHACLPRQPRMPPGNHTCPPATTHAPGSHARPQPCTPPRGQTDACKNACLRAVNIYPNYKIHQRIRLYVFDFTIVRQTQKVPL